MKVLIFDRKIETLSLIAKTFKKQNTKIILAENGSKFLSYFLTEAREKFDAIIICKNELFHYNIDETYFFKNINRPIIVSSYLHSIDYYIKNIKIISSNYDLKKEIKIKKKIKKILKQCKKKNKIDKKIKPNKILTTEIIPNDHIGKKIIDELPKKSALLLKHLILKKEEGLSDAEISKLFWGENKPNKKNCIYNHIYNLRKSLNSKFNNSYVIHKDSSKYRLIKLKEA